MIGSEFLILSIFRIFWAYKLTKIVHFWIYALFRTFMGSTNPNKRQNQKSASYHLLALFLSTNNQKTRFQDPKLQEKI